MQWKVFAKASMITLGVLLLLLLFSGLLGWKLFFLFLFLIFFCILACIGLYIYKYILFPLYHCIQKISDLLGNNNDCNYCQKLPSICSQILEQLQERKNQIHKWKAEIKSTQEMHGTLEQSCQELQSRLSFEQNFRQQVREHLKVGLCFINKEGKIQKDYTSYLETLLEERKLDAYKISPFFFNSPMNQTIKQSFESWLSNIFQTKGSDATSYSIEDLAYSKNARGKIFTKKFRLQFDPIIQDDTVISVMVLIEDRTQESLLQKQVKEQSVLPNASVEFTLEMLRLDPAVLHDFLQGLQMRFRIFEERLRLLQQGTLNRMIIVELLESLNEVKNSAASLQLKSIVQEAEKIEQLLLILKNTPGMFRLEQILEIEESTRKFLDLLSQYENIGSMLAQSQESEAEALTDEEEDVPTSIQLVDIFALRHIQQYMNYAIMTADNFPLELVRLLRQSEMLWGHILVGSNDSNQTFEFHSVLNRVLESLQQTILSHNLNIKIESEQKAILLRGDIGKISNLLAMFLTVSMGRSEVNSDFTIKIQLGYDDQKQETLKIESIANIKNTDNSTMERLKAWRAGVQPYIKACKAYLTTLKWGFMLELPDVCNQRFEKGLTLGLWGTQHSALEESLEEIRESFPMPLYLANDTQAENIDILLIEWDVLEMLQQQYEKKRKNEPKTVFLLVLPDKQKDWNPQLLQDGFLDYISFPFHSHDIKCSLFRSINALCN